MTTATAYHTLLDRIPRAFREAAQRLAMAFVSAADPDASVQAALIGTGEMQAALEDWHASIAAARAWSALQGARHVHVATTVRQHARADQPLTMSVFYSLPFDAAINAYLMRHAEILIDPADLWLLYWERGASVAEASAAELRAEVHRSLAVAIEQGTPLREWREQAARDFGGSHSYYETVYRTNVSQAYSDGQREQAAQYPDVIGFRRLTTRDATTRPNHRAAHGFIYIKDDPRADWYAAPWGFNCRCTDQPVTRAMAKRLGVEFDEQGEPVLPAWPENARPDEGFK